MCNDCQCPWRELYAKAAKERDEMAKIKRRLANTLSELVWMVSECETTDEVMVWCMVRSLKGDWGTWDKKEYGQSEGR
jgi:hypothetical protein